jgi:hypothetical protein
MPGGAGHKHCHAGICYCAGNSHIVNWPQLHSVWHLDVCAAEALWPPYLTPICCTIEGTAATDSVTYMHFTPSAMGPPSPRVLGFSSKTQQSVASVSHSSSQKKRPPPFELPKANDRNGKKGKNADDDDDPHVDTPSRYDADEDYINITSAKETSDVANQSIHEWDAGRKMIERHRTVFMERLTHLYSDDGCETEGFHLCRPQKELDLIAYIVSNLQPSINLKEIESLVLRGND